jgi:hypothetical protein
MTFRGAFPQSTRRFLPKDRLNGNALREPRAGWFMACSCKMHKQNFV